MKPFLDRLAIVTASTNVERALDCLTSWRQRAAYDWPLYCILNGPDASLQADILPHLDPNNHCAFVDCIIGVVPAFNIGVRFALRSLKADIIVAMHDDVLIEEDGWDARVVAFFDAHPACGLAGFGGGTGLGSDDIYQTPYNPMQLARQDFVSNMREAEAHGRRPHHVIVRGHPPYPTIYAPERVAALDGFSQIGRAAFFRGLRPTQFIHQEHPPSPLFQQMVDLGMRHHAFDSMLGAFAKRLGWEAWMIPILCHHFGGRTAVADTNYTVWAQQQIEGGDQGFWEKSHKVFYEQFRKELPIRV